MKKWVKAALENISNNPFRSSQIKKLKGVTNEYRYRVGNYRIIYHVNKDGSLCTILGIRSTDRTGSTERIAKAIEVLRDSKSRAIANPDRNSAAPTSPQFATCLMTVEID